MTGIITQAARALLLVYGGYLLLDRLIARYRTGCWLGRPSDMEVD